MFEIKEKVSNVADDIGEIADSYYKLAVVNAVDKGSKLISILIIGAVIAALIFFGLMFLGFGLSYWIGQFLGNPMWGFLIVAGSLFVICFVIILIKGKTLLPYIQNAIIKNLYD